MPFLSSGPQPEVSPRQVPRASRLRPLVQTARWVQQVPRERQVPTGVWPSREHQASLVSQVQPALRAWKAVLALSEPRVRMVGRQLREASGLTVLKAVRRRRAASERPVPLEERRVVSVRMETLVQRERQAALACWAQRERTAPRPAPKVPKLWLRVRGRKRVYPISILQKPETVSVRALRVQPLAVSAPREQCHQLVQVRLTVRLASVPSGARSPRVQPVWEAPARRLAPALMALLVRGQMESRVSEASQGR